jgi:hypothetical protein
MDPDRVIDIIDKWPPPPNPTIVKIEYQDFVKTTALQRWDPLDPVRCPLVLFLVVSDGKCQIGHRLLQFLGIMHKNSLKLSLKTPPPHIIPQLPLPLPPSLPQPQPRNRKWCCRSPPQKKLRSCSSHRHHNVAAQKLCPRIPRCRRSRLEDFTDSEKSPESYSQVSDSQATVRRSVPCGHCRQVQR